MRKLLFAAMLGMLVGTGSERVHAQARQTGDVRIKRAVFGATQGMADVTPVVVNFTQEGLDEIYVAPRWLEANPAVGQTRGLVIFYEYKGTPHVLTTTELGAVSHAILVEHADPATRRRPSASDASTRAVIHHAYYGQGLTFHDATTRAAEILVPGGAGVVLSDAAMMVRSTQVSEVLIVTYSYRGARNTMSFYADQRVRHDALVAHAESAGDAKAYSTEAPGWLPNTQPAAARGRGRAAAAEGRATRRELGVNELLKAIAELDAIGGRDRSEAISRALAATRQAVTDAQASLGYVYPPEKTPKPKVLGKTTTDRVANAVRALQTALDQFSDANPARGRAAAGAMTRSIAGINDALTALR